MYSSIRIQGYRGLDSFRMEGLGRVNLLVGTNNSGKTSILECIELLWSAGRPHVLWSIAGRRGEFVNEGHGQPPPGSRRDVLDISHLFANRDLRCAIQIEAEFDTADYPAGWNDKVTMHVEDPSSSSHDESGADDTGESLLLRVRWSERDDGYKAPLTEDGFLLGPLRYMRIRDGAGQGVHFVRTSRMTPEDVVQTFSRLVLTPRHETIREALRIVEPEVEDLVPVPAYSRTRFIRDAPGGVVLRLRGFEDPVPIGSMGDGMWHMLGLALSIANADGGVLLIDDIDTGLHYSVMEGMWRMLSEAAAARSFQVFATTHSRDCWESLAAIAQDDGGDVAIQRIDRNRGEAVTFSREAIVVAAERNIEVR